MTGTGLDDFDGRLLASALGDAHPRDVGDDSDELEILDLTQNEFNPGVRAGLLAAEGRPYSRSNYLTSRISKIIGIIVAVAAVPAASWWSLCPPQLQREGQANQIRMDPISLLATKAHPLNARSISTASFV